MGKGSEKGFKLFALFLSFGEGAPRAVLSLKPFKVLRGHFICPLSCSCLSRITRSSLHFDPAFPPDINGLTVTGVSYLGNKLQFTIARGQTRIQVTARAREPPACPLEAVLEASGQRWPLREGAVSPRLCSPEHPQPAESPPRLSRGRLLLQGRASPSPRRPAGFRGCPLRHPKPGLSRV